MLNNKGVGIMEIIVSTVLLALILAGIVNIFISGRRHIAYSLSRMAGGELGKHFLDPLQMHVRQDTWDDTATNSLVVNTVGWNDPANPQIINNVSYSGNYRVTSVNDSGGNDLGLRRVQLTVSWPPNNSP